MAARFATIKGWVVNAASRGDAFLIVGCDTFDYEDYPVFCATADEAREQLAKFDDPSFADRLMEVYDLSLDLDSQLAEHRAMHRPAAAL